MPKYLAANGWFWRKSWHSNPNGACVEVAVRGGVVAVCDSRQAYPGHGTVLPFTAAAFRTFTRRVKNGLEL